MFIEWITIKRFESFIFGAMWLNFSLSSLACNYYNEARNSNCLRLWHHEKYNEVHCDECFLRGRRVNRTSFFISAANLEVFAYKSDWLTILWLFLKYQTRQLKDRWIIYFASGLASNYWKANKLQKTAVAQLEICLLAAIEDLVTVGRNLSKGSLRTDRFACLVLCSVEKSHTKLFYNRNHLRS